jgi:hypothetical protein
MRALSQDPRLLIIQIDVLLSTGSTRRCKAQECKQNAGSSRLRVSKILGERGSRPTGACTILPSAGCSVIDPDPDALLVMRREGDYLDSHR